MAVTKLREACQDWVETTQPKRIDEAESDIGASGGDEEDSTRRETNVCLDQCLSDFLQLHALESTNYTESNLHRIQLECSMA